MSSSLEIMTTAMQPLIVFPFSFDISEMACSCTWLSKPTDMKYLLGWLMQNHSGRGEARLIFTAVLLFNEVCGGDCLGVWKTHLWWVWGARVPSGNISAEPPWSTRKKNCWSVNHTVKLLMQIDALEILIFSLPAHQIWQLGCSFRLCGSSGPSSF